MGQRSEVKSQSDRNLGIVVPKVLSHESPPPEPPELPHGDRTLADWPARSPWHPGHTGGGQSCPPEASGSSSTLRQPERLKERHKTSLLLGPFAACPLRPWKTT